MNKIFLSSVLLASGLLLNVTGAAADPSLPDQCQGRTLKVATFQAGSYVDFQKVFRQTARALQQAGLIKAEGSPLNADYKVDAEGAYAALVKSSRGGCVEFVENGFYDGKWVASDIDRKERDLKARIRDTDDISMVWALGTIAGQRFADSSLGIPVLVMTTTDAENSGIIGRGEFSDRPNIHVQKEVDRYASELRMFYNVFRFFNLGVILDDDPENLAGQAWPAIERLSEEQGFDVTACRGPVIDEDLSKAQTAFTQCVRELAANEDVDAVYLPVGNGASPDGFYAQIKPLIDRKIPTFSQSGENEVRMGALMALSTSDFVDSGNFEAYVIAEILKGKKPEEISQYYYAPLSLCLNLETARRIGWKPDFEMLIAVDSVFQDIATGK